MIELSDPDLLKNKDKILFPNDKITKGDLANYYEKIFPYMYPFVKNHLITMQRFPDGINQEGFYQKNVPEYFPEWIETLKVRNEDGSKTNYALIKNKETLIYLAYQACITIHLWLSEVTMLNYPDKIILDLDPGEKTTFEDIKKYTLLIKEFLEKMGLKSFPMLTGSKGIHVVAPIKPKYKFDETHKFAQDLAKELELLAPEDLTTEIRKDNREGRLFIDYIRNTYGHTAVAPFSVRPIEGAPVATPVTWKDLKDPKIQSQSFNIDNVFEYLKHNKPPDLSLEKWQQIVPALEKKNN